jgi:hypothetical protein
VDALPDPHSPFEYWRWALIEHQSKQPLTPPSMADEATALAAEHFAGLWNLGLSRIQRIDDATAQRLIGMLTRTCADRGHEVAAWVTDPREVTSLLDRLVDVERSDETIVRDAKLWMEMQPPVAVWPAAEFGPVVELRDDACG